MIHFRSKAKFKISESHSMSNNYFKLRKNGLRAINLAAMMIIFSTFIIFFNTFPDSIAVFNPFRAEIGLRGVTYQEAFFIFTNSYLIIIVLILNSLWFTGPWSLPYKSIFEFSKVNFNANCLGFI